jgi:G:T/U-mismatch repair DNA glycosylase
VTELEERLALKWFGLDAKTIDPNTHAWIVGEAPGKNTRSYLPMFPYPRTSSGGRLLQLSGLTPAEYFTIQRRNLIEEYPGIWPKFEAKKQAQNILEDMPRGSRVVLLGRRVGEAFGFTQYFQHETHAGSVYAILPHPSGLNRELNDERVKAAIRMAMHWVAGYTIETARSRLSGS